METRKNTDGNVVVFVALKSLCRFLFVWVVYVAVDIVGCWMIVWQGSCQVKCD